MCTALLLALSLLQAEPAPAPPAASAPDASAAASGSSSPAVKPDAPDAGKADAQKVEPQGAAVAAPEAKPDAPATEGAPLPAADAKPGDAKPSEPAVQAAPATEASVPAQAAAPRLEAAPDAPAAAPAPAADATAATPQPAATPQAAAAPATEPAAPQAQKAVEGATATAEPLPAAPPATTPVTPPVAEVAPASPVPAPIASSPAPAAGCVAGAGWECVRKKSPTHWGLTIDGGFPDAAGIGLVYRPWYWLRLEAAGTTTVYASHGYRAGVSLVPFNFPITPALTLNYGRALEANWNNLYAKFATPDPDLEPVLRKFGYQYVDAHLGLEIGAPRRFVFFLRAGLTQLWTQVHGLTPAAEAQITDASTSVTISDTKITMRVPSVKLGFLLYLF